MRKAKRRVHRKLRAT